MSEEQLPDEYYSEHDIIAAACNALSAMDGYDPITKTGQQRKKRIIARSVLLIEDSINSLYEMFHGKDKDDEEEED